MFEMKWIFVCAIICMICEKHGQLRTLSNGDSAVKDHQQSGTGPQTQFHGGSGQHEETGKKNKHNSWREVGPYI